MRDKGSSLEAFVSADLPVKSAKEDRLNRAKYSAAISKVIRAWRNKPSLVLGLYGGWGNAKEYFSLESIDPMISLDELETRISQLFNGQQNAEEKELIAMIEAAKKRGPMIPGQISFESDEEEET
jgi:hypothetical protein